MKPDEVSAHLQSKVDELRDVPDQAVAVLARESKAVATLIRQTAGRSRHSIDVRVVVTKNTVRMTIIGQQASRYRALAERELDARVPSAKAEIRDIPKGKSR